MKLPDELEIIGPRILVNQRESVKLEENEVAGLAIFDADLIVIAQKTNGVILSESSIAEAFAHEILHHIVNAFDIHLTEHETLCVARGFVAVIRNNKINFLNED
jgi:hypothetical protein